jgi:cell wall-associated NlpC family hydrolase
VPVVTVWNQPGFVRAVDATVVQAQPQVDKWIESMSFNQKVDLGQRMATQALLDDPLTVLGLQGDWAHVLVDEQTGSVYTEGIEGWVPRAQIAFAPLLPGTATATVSVPFTRAGNVELSYGTRLPVVGSSASHLDVATADGLLQVARSDVSTAPTRAGGSAALRQAEQFIGLPYLWAGTSAYGFDCSGLTYAVYRQFGVTLARDAADQAQQGTPVAKDDLRPGDLVFFASGGLVHHVGIYAGAGMMLDAPETGGRIEVVPLWTSYLATQYAGARRYINP